MSAVIFTDCSPLRHPNSSNICQGVFFWHKSNKIPLCLHVCILLFTTSAKLYQFIFQLFWMVMLKILDIRFFYIVCFNVFDVLFVNVSAIVNFVWAKIAIFFFVHRRFKLIVVEHSTWVFLNVSSSLYLTPLKQKMLDASISTRKMLQAIRNNSLYSVLHFIWIGSAHSWWLFFVWIHTRILELNFLHTFLVDGLPDI